MKVEMSAILYASQDHTQRFGPPDHERHQQSWLIWGSHLLLRHHKFDLLNGLLGVVLHNMVVIRIMNLNIYNKLS